MKLTTKLCATGAALATTAALGLVPAVNASAASTSASTSAGMVPAVTAQSAAATPILKSKSVIHQVIAGVGTFDGSFKPKRFANRNGTLVVTGVVTGALTTATGTVVPVRQQVTTPIKNGSAGAASAAPTAAAVSCKVLDLVLGPLHLDLLGLVVDLNQVHLLIQAVPGAGALLGNLLCAVAGLLDGVGINQLAALLNALLGL